MLHREPGVPPPFTPWTYRDDFFARLRKRAGYAGSDILLAPVARVLNAYRRKHGLPQYRSAAESFSTLAQMSQQPAAFDFPRHALPAHFHYCGPLRRPPRHSVPFPWERLDGRPLIYASLGTLQKEKASIFQAFAEACRELEVQLVITHGGNLGPAAARFPGDPIVVAYAPQRELLSRAALTLTHAGLNTVLDSLSFGVPLVAVPITFEQPAIAARLQWTGTGEVIHPTRLEPTIARRAIRQVLENPSYRERAGAIARSIREAGGVERAASLVEA
jgi:MGT family glycosyltransferase